MLHVNRAETQFALQRFFDRVACATVADVTLAESYVEVLRGYLSKLEADFEPNDPWSVGEYARVCEFVNNNFEWIASRQQTLRRPPKTAAVAPGHQIQGVRSRASGVASTRNYLRYPVL